MKFRENHDIAKTSIFPKEYQGFGASRITKTRISIKIMNFMKFLENPWIFRIFMIFMNFHDFYIKNGKRTPPHARTPKSSPDHWNTKQIHRSRRGAIRPETIKTTQNLFSALFGQFLPRINKISKILNFPVKFAKRGSLGGPARRSLFFLRNIKVSEPPVSGKSVRNCYFLEFSWNFMKF